MASRQQYRLNLQTKLLNLEDGGYGDFDYEDADLNFYLALAVAKMYPAIYKRKVQSGLTLVTYGSQNLASVTPTYPDRVFLIEDAVERTPVLGWHVSGTDIVDIDPCQSSAVNGGNITTVNVYYHDAYALDGVTTDAGYDSEDLQIPDIYEVVINLGALIEAVESRQDTGVRGDPPPIGQFQEMSILDRLNQRYDKALERLAMGLPAVQI